MSSDFLQTLPEPHILDYDWRFTEETVSKLTDLVRPTDTVLTVGTPSLARDLETKGLDVILVDRQPFNAVRNHSQIEPGSSNGTFANRTVAILDPPWYPAEAKVWIAWAAHAVGKNSKIIVSLWPDTTRPTAAEEFSDLKSWASEWGDVQLLDVVPKYDTPLFERAAHQASGSKLARLSPGFGRLLCIHIKRIPQAPDVPSPSTTWIRFVVNDYQLAISLDAIPQRDSVTQHPLAKEWIWPYVSRRAPQRSLINLWSSRNEVALINAPDLAVEALRKAFNTSGAEAFSCQLGQYRRLEDLDIPRPPYRRLVEWHHKQ